MTGATPMISIVMAAYQHAEYIEESVNSVWSQSYPNVELVVVDDASTDGTPAILKELRKHSPIPMRVFYNKENQGPNRTLNRAVGLAYAGLIGFLASDDKFAPNRFESQTKLFSKEPDLMIVYGNGWSFRNGNPVARLHGDEVKELLSQNANEILRYLYTHSSPFYLQTALVKKDFLLACGGYDEDVLADDWVLNIRFFQHLVRSGNFAYLDEDLAYYRLHDSNLHKNISRQVALKKEVVEKYTPDHLKREALGNIYWKQGQSAFSNSFPLTGIKCLLLSQVYQLQPRRFWTLLYSSIRACLMMSKKQIRNHSK